MKRKICILLVVIMLIASLFILTGCGDKSEETKQTNEKNNSSEATDEKVTKTYAYYFDTDIPTLQSVFDYEKPFMRNDIWAEFGEYYETFTDADMDGFRSKVNKNHLTEYKNILIENGYSETESNVLTKDNMQITLELEDTTFSITIIDTTFEE